MQALLGCPSFTRAVLRRRAYLEQTAVGQALHDFIALSGAGDPAGVPGGAPVQGEPSSFSGEARRPPQAGQQQLEVLRELVAHQQAHHPRAAYAAPGGQKSASEGLELLLDCLAPSGESRGGGSCPIARLFLHRFTARAACGACSARSSTAADSGVILDVFHPGATAAPAATPETFSETIASHTAPLEDYKCEKCGRRGAGHRSYSLRMVGK